MIRNNDTRFRGYGTARVRGNFLGIPNRFYVPRDFYNLALVHFEGHRYLTVYPFQAPRPEMPPKAIQISIGDLVISDERVLTLPNVVLPYIGTHKHMELLGFDGCFFRIFRPDVFEKYVKEYDVAGAYRKSLLDQWVA